MVNAYRKGIYRMVNELPGTEPPFLGDISMYGIDIEVARVIYLVNRFYL